MKSIAAINKLCECGCGLPTPLAKSSDKRCGHVKGKPIRFINGHNKAFKGKHHSDKNKLAASKLRIGVKRPPFSSEHRSRMARAKMGDVNPSKRQEVKRKISDTKHARNLPGPWAGKKRPSETKAKLSISMKRLWQDQDFAREMGRKQMRRLNKPERALLALLDDAFPGEWNYTGDFTLVVDGKSPDFANVSGQKKLIEMFGDYWHRGDDGEQRKNHFRRFGYETLIIWEHEMDDTSAVLRRIKEFCDQ